MKSEILRHLRESEGHVSGQELCDRFQVSRTAIWKVMKQLEEEGYEIEAVRNKGYRLVSSSDVLNKATLESLLPEREIVYFESVDSTNVQAKILAEQGGRHGSLVVGNQQLGGKGRRGRVWESPKDVGIFMSILLRPNFEPKVAPMLTLVMAYAIGKVLKEKQGFDVEIKWPNDIIVNKKKVCGILTEMSAEIDFINYVVIGTGINCNNDSFIDEIAKIATSLKIEKGQVTNRASLIAGIIEEFEVQYEEFCKTNSLEHLKNAYNELLVNRGKVVKVMEHNNPYEGEAIGINDEGELLVKVESGEVKNIYAGEVSIRGIYGYV